MCYSRKISQDCALLLCLQQTSLKFYALKNDFFRNTINATIFLVLCLPHLERVSYFAWLIKYITYKNPICMNLSHVARIRQICFVIIDIRIV